MNQSSALIILLMAYVPSVSTNTTASTTTTTTDASTSSQSGGQSSGTTTTTAATTTASPTTTVSETSGTNTIAPQAPGQSSTPSTTNSSNSTTASSPVPPKTSPSPIITTTPIACLRGLCSGNSSCLAGISTTCPIALGEKCYQTVTSNSSSDIMKFDVGCKTSCEALRQDATYSTGDIRQQTVCCETSMCNNVTLEYPESAAPTSKQQRVVLVLAVFGAVVGWQFSK